MPESTSMALRRAIDKARKALPEERSLLTGDELTDIIEDIAISVGCKLPDGMQKLYEKARTERDELFGVARSFATMSTAAGQLQTT